MSDVGSRYGMLTVIDRRYTTRLRPVCDCGAERTARLADLERGWVQSCGCLRRRPFEKSYRVDPDTDCWLWTASANSGYGRVGTPVDGEYAAHRVSWMRNRGPIPDGMWVLHRCDTPRCVNPDHLFLGTRSDNMQDMVRKGRNRNQHLAPSTRNQNGAGK